MIKIYLNLTASKLYAYLLLLLGTAFAFYSKEVDAFVITATVGGALLGAKTVTDNLKSDKKQVKD